MISLAFTKIISKTDDTQLSSRILKAVCREVIDLTKAYVGPEFPVEIMDVYCNIQDQAYLIVTVAVGMSPKELNLLKLRSPLLYGHMRNNIELHNNLMNGHWGDHIVKIK